mgnify:CR=1
MLRLIQRLRIGGQQQQRAANLQHIAEGRAVQLRQSQRGRQINHRVESVVLHATSRAAIHNGSNPFHSLFIFLPLPTA